MKTKIIAKKSSNKKVVKKVEKNVEAKKVEIKIAPQKSISRIVFKFIEDKKLLECDNRKAEYINLLELVKKDFPNSKFQKTHFFWYISRAKKQLENNLGLEHLKTIKKEIEETEE